MNLSKKMHFYIKKIPHEFSKKKRKKKKSPKQLVKFVPSELYFIF
jgi:hypothetical protein